MSSDPGGNFVIKRGLSREGEQYNGKSLCCGECLLLKDGSYGMLLVGCVLKSQRTLS